MVNLFAYRFKLETPKGNFLNEQGIYPCFPNSFTKKLFIVQDAIQAATLMQSGILENREAVIALHNGRWNSEHQEVIESLSELEQIVLINCHVENITHENTIKISKVLLDDTVNECWLAYGAKGLWSMIQEQLKTTEKEPIPTHQKDKISVISETEFKYEGVELDYTILGNLPSNPTFLEMQFEFRTTSGDVLRTKLNLLDSGQVQKALFDWSESNDLNFGQCMLEVNHITDELQNFRRIKTKGEQLPVKGFNTQRQQKAKELLKEENLFEQLNELLGQTGIISENQNRLLLFIIATSYKFDYNLHAVIQANQMESASELITQIAACIPQMDQYMIDLTTSRSFRYYGNSVINGKLLVIPDYSGVTSNKGILDLKRLQAKGTINNDAPKKTANGLLHTIKQQVKGHGSSIGACKNTKRYFENEPKTVVVAMDNSKEKLQQLMEYDCRKMAGLIDEKQEEAAKELLRYVVNNLHPLQIINPFASKLMLPIDIPYARTLTIQLLNFVSLITLFNQHKRDKDESGRVVTTEKDVQTAIDLFLNAIVINVDELDATTRDFFEQLKELVKDGVKGKKTMYSSLQIREALNISKTTVNRYLRTLVEYEYIKKIGYKNTGYKYQITSWNNMEHIRKTLNDRFTVPSEPAQQDHQNLRKIG